MPIPSDDLTESDRELIAYAQRIVDEHGDDDVHTMGAAVRAQDGSMFGGINLYHFTGGPCAELVAIGHARASGAGTLTTIVACGDRGRGPVGPCGKDRQILLDYHQGIRVILPTEHGVRGVRITDLMPLGAVWNTEGGTKPFDPTMFRS
jgi:cytidine deaminase